MNRCKDCKWWTPTKMKQGGFTCIQPKANIGYAFTTKDIPVDGVWIEDDEGWAWFTGPDFGCVNFKAKGA